MLQENMVLDLPCQPLLLKNSVQILYLSLVILKNTKVFQMYLNEINIDIYDYPQKI